MTDQPKISPADLAEMSDTRSFDEAWHSENRYGREKLEAENAELKRQLAAVERWMNRPGDHVWRHFPKNSNIYIEVSSPRYTAHGQWQARKVTYKDYHIAGRMIADTLGELVLAMEFAGWLPKPEATKGA